MNNSLNIPVKQIIGKVSNEKADELGLIQLTDIIHYVSQLISYASKGKVIVATQQPFDLASNGNIIDGETIPTGGSVFFFGQTDAKENGAYTFSGGTWARDSRMDMSAVTKTGHFFIVEKGTHINQQIVVTSQGSGTAGAHVPGTDVITAKVQGFAPSALTIGENGQVGLGTTSPMGKLHIRDLSGSQNAGMIIGGPDNATLESYDLFKTGNPSLTIFGQNNAQGSYPFTVLSDNASTLFYVEANGTSYFGGNVGLGTTTPGYKLDVSGQVRANNVAVNSDARYKEAIQPLTTETIEKLSLLKGASYQFRDEFIKKGFKSGHRLGFIAQEIQEVYPELVSEDQEGYLSVNYTGLIPVLVEAVKELREQNKVAKQTQLEQITTLKTENEQLMNELASMKQRMAAIEEMLANRK